MEPTHHDSGPVKLIHGDDIQRSGGKARAALVIGPARARKVKYRDLIQSVRLEVWAVKDRTALLTPLHVGLSVSDMDRSIRWYRKALGFELLRDGYEPFLSARVTFLRHPCGLELELFQYDAPKPLPDERRTPNTDLQTIGTKHLCFHHPDVAGFLAGIPDPDIAAGPLDMHGDVVVFLRDPDGILLEFIQSSKPK